MKHLFSSEDQMKIEAAVKAAEARTSGEIVPVIAETSGDYSYVGHRLGLAGAVVATLAAYLLPHLEYLFWEVSLVFALQAAGWAAGWALGQWAPVVRAFAGKKHLDVEVHETALASFLQYGLHRTRERTGVLIFLSLLEHRVEILADEGIHAKVGEDYWRRETTKIALGLRQGRGAAALAQVIGEVGEKLTEHFPAPERNENELSDELRRR